MEKYTNNEIYIMLENLTKQVEEGFAGIYARQDKTNGNVRSLEKRFWAIAGGLVVISLIVVPLFLDIIKKS